DARDPRAADRVPGQALLRGPRFGGAFAFAGGTIRAVAPGVVAVAVRPWSRRAAYSPFPPVQLGSLDDSRRARADPARLRVRRGRARLRARVRARGRVPARGPARAAAPRLGGWRSGACRPD